MYATGHSIDKLQVSTNNEQIGESSVKLCDVQHWAQKAEQANLYTALLKMNRAIAAMNVPSPPEKSKLSDFLHKSNGSPGATKSSASSQHDSLTAAVHNIRLDASPNRPDVREIYDCICSERALTSFIVATGRLQQPYGTKSI